MASVRAGQSEIAQCAVATCPLVDGKTTHVVTIYWNETRSPDVNSYNCPPRTATDHRCFRLMTR